MHMRGSWDASHNPFGMLLKAFWGLSAASRGLLGASWELPGCLLGPLGGASGASGGLL